MPAPSLITVAQRACVKVIPNITDVAETPYELILPVLKRIRNPQQLREIEEKSSHIADADAELWRSFIARDIPNWQDKIVEPKNPRSWWKVYRKLMREEERAKEEDDAKLAAAMSGAKQEKNANRAQFVSKVLPEVGPGTRPAFLDGNPNPYYHKQSGITKVPALKNAKRGTDVLAALKKQSAQAAKDRSIHRKNGFDRTLTAVSDNKSQIKALPAWMVNEQKKPQPAAAASFSPATKGRMPTQSVFAPRKGLTAQEKTVNEAIRKSNAEKEARLRALTGSKPVATTAPSPPASARPTARVAAAARLSPPQSVPGRASSPPAPAGLTATVAAAARLSPPKPVAGEAAGSAKKRPASTASIFMPKKKVRR
ncbi:hypothetical protein B0A50_07153 [Salinomyces thailandicus]|uniref:Elongin-A n=1 Tax=Salinomyces thailandicus TaxID=706561 RepID=A0A4U0TMD7_9PEZI|nr:hypothetical protein B0A50_07153 [Salinomyces thailandica]